MAAKKKPIETMTLDELVSYRVALKRDIREKQDVLRSTNERYKALVRAERVTAKIRAIGLEGQVVIPGAAKLEAEGQ